MPFLYSGCTLSPREPETRRERECRWEYSPRSLGARVSPCWSFTFLVVRDARVLRSCLAVASCRVPKSFTHRLTEIGEKYIWKGGNFRKKTLSKFRKKTSKILKQKNQNFQHTQYSRSRLYTLALLSCIESRTLPVSSQATLAWDSCQMHSARVYSRHYSPFFWPGTCMFWCDFKNVSHQKKSRLKHGPWIFNFAKLFWYSQFFFSKLSI